jgi:hypothetical protein
MSLNTISGEPIEMMLFPVGKISPLVTIPETYNSPNLCVGEPKSSTPLL